MTDSITPPQPIAAAPIAPVEAAHAPETSTHISVRNTVVQQAPDHRDMPTGAGLPWWRYAFPTAVDLVAVIGLIGLLWAGKLRAEWSQGIALLLIALLAGVRSADLSSMIRGGPGVPPGGGPAAMVGALIVSGAHILTRAASSGRATAHTLLGVMGIACLLSVIAVPSLLWVFGGLR